MFIVYKGNEVNLEKHELYQFYSKNNIECLYAGFFTYRRSQSLEQSIDRLINDFLAGDIRFNDFLGSFRIILINYKTKSTLVFCDNSGSACFFINEKESIVSDSYIDLVDLSKNLTPNYLAIVQFLQAAKIFGLDTLCMDIQRTDPYCYYIMDSRGITKKEKGLASLSKLNNYSTLHEIIAVIINSVRSFARTVVITTGGTDSRTVLAHLMSYNLPFDLAISGNEQHEDVQSAKEIAEFIGKKLLISDEEPLNDSWVMESFYAADGLSGVFQHYRLYRFYQMLQERGYTLVFGGVNGEIHKNCFLEHEFPFLCSGKVNLKKFYKSFFTGGIYPEILKGEYIKPYFSIAEQETISKMSELVIDERKKNKAYNKIGYWLMQNTVVGVTNSTLRYATLISPLFERDCVAINYNVNPWKLVNKKFSRKEVSQWCPEIAKIPTVHGYTCSNKTKDIIIENITCFFRKTRRLFNKIINLKRTIINRRSIKGRIDMCFDIGMKTNEFQYAINKCKELKILPIEIESTAIPPTIADRLTTIGLLFAGKDREKVIKGSGIN